MTDAQEPTFFGSLMDRFGDDELPAQWSSRSEPLGLVVRTSRWVVKGKPPLRWELFVGDASEASDSGDAATLPECCAQAEEAALGLLREIEEQLGSGTPALESRIKKLEAALKPFADCWEKVCADFPEEDPDTEEQPACLWFVETGSHSARWPAYREAWRVLKEAQGGD